MAITLLSQTQSFENTSTINNVVSGINAGVGTYIVVQAQLQSGSGGSSACVVTDSSSNTYAYLGTSVQIGSNSRVFIFGAPVFVALSSGSVTFNTEGTSFVSVVLVSVWSGISQPWSTVATTTTAATTTPAAASVSVPEAGDLVIGSIAVESVTGTASTATLGGTGWTAMLGGAPGTSGNFYVTAANAYQIVTTTGSFGPSWATTSDASASVTAVLRPGPLNWLTNPSFETAGTGGNPCMGWIDEHNTATLPTYTQSSSTGVVDGSFAQEAQYTGVSADTTVTGDGAKFELYQTSSTGTQQIFPGQWGSFSIWVAGSVTGTALIDVPVIGIETFNSSSTFIAASPGGTFTLTSTPTLYQCHFLFPANSYYFACYLQIPGIVSGSVVTLYADNASMSVRQLPPFPSAITTKATVISSAVF